MSTRLIDVSGLPTYAFSHRGIMWWGTLGMVVIEGTVFAIALVVYYYLRGLDPMSVPGRQAFLEDASTGEEHTAPVDEIEPESPPESLSLRGV